MIEKMDKSNRKVLGFRLIGDVSKSDYDVMVPVVQSVIDKRDLLRYSLTWKSLNGKK